MERGRRKLWISLGLGIITLIAYSRVCFNDFVNYDDPDYVVENPHVKAGLTGDGIRWAFVTLHAHNWHPLTWLSLQLESQLFELQAWGFHLTNLVLHVTNAIVLFLVLSRMTGGVWPSAFVAGLFAVHPLHVESVAWVAERKDVLSTCFWMLTLWAYIGYVERPGLIRYLLVVAGLALGLMAKPMVVTLPFVLLLLDFWPLGRWRTSGVLVVWEKIPLVALAVFAGVVTLFSQRGAIADENVLPLSARLANALVAYVGYAGKMLWPSGLAVFYPHPLDGVPIGEVIAAALALATITGLAFWQVRRRPYLLVGWLWFLGTLLPVIGLIQAGNQALADRFTYVPLIGLFIGVTWGIVDLAGGDLRSVERAGSGDPRPAPGGPAKWGLAIAACSIVMVLAGCSWIQTGYWRDSTALWEHTLQVTTNNAVAHNNLGVALWQASRHEEATGHFDLAFRIQPNYGNAKHNLEVAHFELGMELRGRGKWQDAADHFYQAALVNPENDSAIAQRGIVFGLLDRWSEALECFKQAVNLQPNLAQYRADLALSFEEQGQTEAAQLQYREALRLDSAWPERARQAAWTLATDPDPARRDAGRALQLARQICQAVPVLTAEIFDTLAAAYAEAGQFDEALDAAHAAVRLAGQTSGGLSDSAKTGPALQEIETRILLYEKGQPYREKAMP